MGRISTKIKNLLLLLCLVAGGISIQAQTLSWDELGSDITGTQKFGVNVSFNSDGTIMAAGAMDGTSVPGSVEVYQLLNDNWVKIGSTIDGGGEATNGDNFGRFTSLSANGTILAVGAPGIGNGYVKVYEYSGGTWTQLGSKLTGDTGGDAFGTCVSLNADGTRLAVGAYKFDSGINTDDGQVKIYDYSSDWTETASIEEGVAGDYAGYSVSLSSDGTLLAVGGYKSDVGGADRGITRIYHYNSGTWENFGVINGDTDSEESGVSVSFNSDITIDTFLQLVSIKLILPVLVATQVAQEFMNMFQEPPGA